MAIFLPGNKTERVGELVRAELLEVALIDRKSLDEAIDAGASARY
jgi:hypothetical protein